MLAEKTLLRYNVRKRFRTGVHYASRARMTSGIFKSATENLRGELSRRGANFPRSLSERTAHAGDRRIAEPSPASYIARNDARTGWPTSCTCRIRHTEERRARRRHHSLRRTYPAQRATDGHNGKGRQRHGHGIHGKGERPARFILQSPAHDFAARTKTKTTTSGTATDYGE